MATARKSLIGLQVLYVLFTPVWIVFSMVFLMSFDDPSFAKLSWLRDLCYVTLVYPVVAIAAAVAGWILFTRGRYGNAVGLNLVPLLWVVSILGFTLYVFLG